ncbi:hypothetical protein [Catenuloplanes atrovinosus]|uniref:Uncharacterized protein n=1 Tax=Catenuloplanes atrovinosus TaxID=137266 RepID=A0AAE3YMH4_9ACTN|nr:hypothetical protein [Catenuloplanes atrovinosus]MDR7275782.1 hypothetical protein [Catenuloplanes atrovinosus]
MRSTQWARDLLGPADPARAPGPVPPPVPARALIARADRTPDAVLTVRSGTASIAPAVAGRPAGEARVPRRAVLIGAAAGVSGVALGSTVLARAFPGGAAPESAAPAGSAPYWDDVLSPIAFEITEGAPPAADRLRELAGRLTPSTAEAGTGGYLASHERFWERGRFAAPGAVPAGPGSPSRPGTPASPDGARSWPGPPGTPSGVPATPHVTPPASGATAVPPNSPPGGASPAGTPSRTAGTDAGPWPGPDAPAGAPDAGVAYDRWVWWAPGEQAERASALRLEYVSAAARDRWHANEVPSPAPQSENTTGSDVRTTDELIAGLTGAGRRETIETAIAIARRGTDCAGRARFLRALADTGPRWLWRGGVTDRLGRAGMAISVEPDDSDPGRAVLVFHPGTGELLCVERSRPDEHGGQLDAYHMVLGSRLVSESGRTW